MTVLSFFWNWTVVSMRFNHINCLPSTTRKIMLGVARQTRIGENPLSGQKWNNLKESRLFFAHPLLPVAERNMDFSEGVPCSFYTCVLLSRVKPCTLLTWRHGRPLTC